MAKSLPYFKFYCSEWNDGNITMHDLPQQGLFINICSLYWSRKGDLTKDFVLRRFPMYSNCFDTLVEDGIINLNKNLNKENIEIRFLDEQLGNRDGRSTSSRVNGSKGGRPKKPKNLNKNLNKPNIEEKRREERKEIIDYLNKLTGKRYRKDKGLLARLNEGYTVEDCKRVISIKVAEWTGTDQAIYIRPETLFGNKFDGYLNQELKSTYKDLPFHERDQIYIDKDKQEILDIDGNISTIWEYDVSIKGAVML